MFSRPAGGYASQERGEQRCFASQNSPRVLYLTVGGHA